MECENIRFCTQVLDVGGTLPVLVVIAPKAMVRNGAMANANGREEDV